LPLGRARDNRYVAPMFQNITVTFIFIIGCFSLIISIGQLFVITRRIENYNLSIIFFCISILLFQSFFIFNGMIFIYPNVLFSYLTLSSLLGPLLYYAYFFLCLPDIKLPRKTLLLLLPSLLLMAGDFSYLFSPYEDKIVILNYLYKSQPAPDELVIKNLFILPYIGNSIAQILILLKLISIRHSVKVRNIVDVSIVHVVVGFLITVMFSFAYLIRSMQFLKISTIALCLSTAGAFFINQRYPEYLQLVIIDTVRNRYKRSRLAGIDAESVGRQLIDLMELEKMFADEDLSLKRLAYELSMTPHQLSQFLNEKLNSNFNTFVNRYRVDEAKKMLIEEPDRSILSVCHGVGFNSKSVFYKAFMQSTGMTPFKFRKQFLSGEKK
jgi:AraC-like DNA-binding protein